LQRGSYLLTKELALRAIHLVLDNIFPKMVEDGTFKRPDLHIVVLDPMAVFGSSKPEEHSHFDMNTMIGGPVSSSIRWSPLLQDDIILAEHSIGDPGKWEWDFKAIARDKAFQTRKHETPNQLIVERAPWLLHGTSFPFWGSAYRDGLVVAASGVQPWYDQMLSEMVASAIAALCMNEMRKPGGILEEDRLHMGTDEEVAGFNPLR